MTKISSVAPISDQSGLGSQTWPQAGQMESVYYCWAGGQTDAS